MVKNEKMALITNIQRFCIHDGPGIRTTVFFKGCNMRCIWCHNPESHLPRRERMLYRNKCVNCGACREVCHSAFDSECSACGKCLSICNNGARIISGRSIGVNELFSELEKDRAFYTTSGGGVTFSGGEPLLQAQFLEEILIRCKEASLHTAVETAANVHWQHFQTLVPYIDLIIFDLKAIDSRVHIACTGVDNDEILRNAQFLMDIAPQKLLFRMPVIPGYNDCEVESVVRFVRGHRLELMPYHAMGMGKYDALGREYTLKNVNPPTREWLRCITQKYENVFCQSTEGEYSNE